MKDVFIFNVKLLGLMPEFMADDQIRNSELCFDTLKEWSFCEACDFESSWVARIREAFKFPRCCGGLRSPRHATIACVQDRFVFMSLFVFKNDFEFHACIHFSPSR